MTDDAARWIARARAGEPAAFRHLVDANGPALFRVCVRITGDRALAEDAVQEALLNAFRHLAEFDGRSAFSTWLYRIGVNAALAQVRKRRPLEVAWPQGEGEGAMPFDAADESPTPDRQAISAEIRHHVNAELARMTPMERAAFVLRHHEGRSIEEICAVRSINVSAAKQAIFRAVHKLRTALEAPGEVT
jgi:RNA polymerase sigma-70 factor (ECF subfamily)